MNKIMIAPSILSADFCKMAEAVENLYNWGADLVHCDVMDGVFVPNITFGIPMISALKKYSKLPLDVHLMITEPEKYVGEFCKAGADIVTFHPDASKDVKKTLDIIKECGVKCGLVLNPNIPLSVVEPYMNDIDILVLMSVYAGFGGQSFIEDTIAKLEQAKAMINTTGRDIMLEIDGGINEGNISRVLNAGANVIVAGSAVFNSANPKATVDTLRTNETS